MSFIYVVEGLFWLMWKVSLNKYLSYDPKVTNDKECPSQNKCSTEQK